LDNEEGLAGKNVLFWDMSRDSKTADYADGQYIVAAVEGGTLYYSADSGETFNSYSASAGVRDWMAVTINYEGEKLSALVRGTDTATVSGSTLCTVIRSKDFGYTWTRSTKAGTGEFAQLVANFEGSKLYMTVNGEIPAIKRSYDQVLLLTSFQKLKINSLLYFVGKYLGDC
jgi:hypothetical protein